MPDASDKRMVLYWGNGSMHSWQVMLLLHELGVDYEARRLKLMGIRETRSREFLAINPRGEVPALVDGSHVVCESWAMLFYLSERFREPDLLMRAHAPTHGRVLQSMFETNLLRKAYRPLEALFLGVDRISAYERQQARAAPDRVFTELETWEERLEQTDHIAHDTFTLADCVFYATLGYQLRRGLDLSDFPKLQAYVERVAARPSAVAAHPVGWKGVGKANLFRQATRIAE